MSVLIPQPFTQEGLQNGFKNMMGSQAYRFSSCLCLLHDCNNKESFRIADAKKKPQNNSRENLKKKNPTKTPSEQPNSNNKKNKKQMNN